jgi:hypothetical protein
MNKQKTTEELVRKCFCSFCEYCKQGGAWCDQCTLGDWVKLARAARRFVRLEDIRKKQEAHERFLRSCRKRPTIHEKDVKLPKHWGQFKINGEWI